eukprot:7744443-Pyramimonas_sp.AAC.1
MRGQLDRFCSAETCARLAGLKSRLSQNWPRKRARGVTACNYGVSAKPRCVTVVAQLWCRRGLRCCAGRCRCHRVLLGVAVCCCSRPCHDDDSNGDDNGDPPLMVMAIAIMVVVMVVMTVVITVVVMVVVMTVIVVVKVVMRV